MKTPENKDEDPDNPKAADKGDLQMEYSSDQLHSPRLEAGRGGKSKNSDQNRYCLMIWNI